MITNINEFSHKIKNNLIKKINERYIITEEEEKNMVPVVTPDDSTDEIETTDDLENTENTEDNTLSFDEFKQALIQNFNDADAATSENEEIIDTPVMLSDDQINVVMNTLKELNIISVDVSDESEFEPAEGDEEDKVNDSDEDDEDEEVVEGDDNEDETDDN